MRKYKIFADGIGYQDGKARVIVGGNFYNTGLKEIRRLHDVCMKYIAAPERPAMEAIFSQNYITWADFRDIVLLFTAEQARREEWGYRDTCLNDREQAAYWASRRMRHNAPEFFKNEIQKGVLNAKGAIYMAGWPGVEKYWARIESIKEEAK